ncbi:MAG: hypothetical protein LQ350_008505 [Teloschistes chrysophthalmus]|nr:MAG: hypothetical protein LQ350_008505 [Niorma chrysophthalma]
MAPSRIPIAKFPGWRCAVLSQELAIERQMAKAAPLTGEELVAQRIASRKRQVLNNLSPKVAAAAAKLALVYTHHLPSESILTVAFPLHPSSLPSPSILTALSHPSSLSHRPLPSILTVALPSPSILTITSPSSLILTSAGLTEWTGQSLTGTKGG